MASVSRRLEERERERERDVKDCLPKTIKPPEDSDGFLFDIEKKQGVGGKFRYRQSTCDHTVTTVGQANSSLVRSL